MKALWAGLALLAIGDGAPDPDARAAETHTDELLAGNVVVRWVPGSMTTRRAREEGERAEEALRAVEAALDQALDRTPTLYLYPDAEDLAARTGMPSCWGAFARGDRIVHASLGAPLRHEWTHLVARRVPGAAADPGEVLREGLAAAVEGTDRGVSVEDWAAVERRLGLLASLEALRLRWPSGPPEEAHPDHAAGAFVRFLLDTRGLARVKALLARPGDPAGTLGATWADLDAEWLLRLDARAVPAEKESEVRKWFGLSVERRAPADRARTEDLLRGERPLDRFAERRAGAWRSDGRALVGTGPEDWFAALDWHGSFPAGTALRAVLVPGPGATTYLRVGRRDDRSDEAILGPGGVFLTLGGGDRGLARAPRVRIAPGRRVEAVLEVSGTRARLWLDGWLVHDAEDAVQGGEGGVGIGVRGGDVRVEALEALLPAE
jgi:hypothetical protein